MISEQIDYISRIKEMVAKVSPEQKLKSIRIYCEGVKSDFPAAKVWMDNIIALTGENP